MNLPNKLTVSRFVLTAVFMGAVFWRSPLNDTLALLLFSAASLTDYFDGKIARSRNLITNFGALMDPLADKILTCAAFIALVERGQMLNNETAVKVHAWMVIVIVSRELAIMEVAILNGADYEYQAHVPFALKAGMTQAQLDALPGWQVSDAFPPKMRAVLAYTDAMTRNIRVPEPVFAAVRCHFDEREVVELTATIGGYNLVSRFLEAVQMPHETGVLKAHD